MGKRKGDYFKVEVRKGQRFNRLTVIREVEEFVQPSGQSQRGFLCKCDCGNTKRIRLSHLRHNRVRSCGCLAPERHGDSGSPLHTIWRGMVNRATRDSYTQSYLYKDRGITVCREWRDRYTAFRDWALENGFEEGLTLDRIDNNDGYSPDNCRFVTQLVNNCNRRNTRFINYKGRKVAFALLLRRKGLAHHYAAISERISRGWDQEMAVDTPIRKGKYKKSRGYYQKMEEA